MALLHPVHLQHVRILVEEGIRQHTNEMHVELSNVRAELWLMEQTNQLLEPRLLHLLDDLVGEVHDQALDQYTIHAARLAQRGEEDRERIATLEGEVGVLRRQLTELQRSHLQLVFASAPPPPPSSRVVAPPLVLPPAVQQPQEGHSHNTRFSARQRAQGN
jgi:hypothetical protein